MRRSSSLSRGPTRPTTRSLPCSTRRERRSSRATAARNVETVNANSLPQGTYKALACAFAAAAPVDYTGKLEITTTARASEPSLPSAPRRASQFSASVAADNQRDESEPLLEIDKAGNVYDCGPTGFSNASDYAQVSPPNQGGDQFHLLGTPPRGQQGAGGGGDCGLAFGTEKNSRRQLPVRLHRPRPADRFRHVDVTEQRAEPRDRRPVRERGHGRGRRRRPAVDDASSTPTRSC